MEPGVTDSMEAGRQRICNLAVAVSGGLKPGMKTDAQKELGALVNLLHRIEHAKAFTYLESVEIAELATRIRVSLDENVPHVHTSFRRMLNRGSPPTTVVSGLILSLCFTVLGMVVILALNLGDSLGIETPLLALVALAGALGGITSIMVRIQDFSGQKDLNPAVLFFTGLFKPVVGMAFALLVFSAIKAGVMPLAIADGKERFFFMALAFVSGFSERFARDIISKVEDKA